MAARWVIMLALVVAGLLLPGCSGIAQPAGQGAANDGWVLSLFVLVLILVLMVWLLFAGPEKPAEQEAAAHGDAHGHGHGDAPAHGHAVEEHTEAARLVAAAPESAAPIATAAAAASEPAALQETAAPLPAPAAPRLPDDLKVIEGIGPKISSLLIAAGITTFAQLAETDVAHLRQILADANLSRLADPGTWPEQASLAAAGDWDGLKALTDSLRGGRRS